MTDAATALANELRQWSQSARLSSGQRDAMERAADMLLELARENAAMTGVESLCFPCAETDAVSAELKRVRAVSAGWYSERETLRATLAERERLFASERESHSKERIAATRIINEALGQHHSDDDPFVETATRAARALAERERELEEAVALAKERDGDFLLWKRMWESANAERDALKQKLSAAERVVADLRQRWDHQNSDWLSAVRVVSSVRRVSDVHQKAERCAVGPGCEECRDSVLASVREAISALAAYDALPRS